MYALINALLTVDEHGAEGVCLPGKEIVEDLNGPRDAAEAAALFAGFAKGVDIEVRLL